MPLHLLGKKSWNVYNTANIEKVKQDEAAAAAREAAEEQRMQEVDAERRVQALRGLQVDPLPTTNESPQKTSRAERVSGSLSGRKRRRIDGEDDTERDIRYAKESQLADTTEVDGPSRRQKMSDAPLVDRSGHINLFPVGGTQRNGPKNPEAEADVAKKKREYEDQYTMRFSNAAGFKQAIGEKPWYHSMQGPGSEDMETASKDVWGNEDLRRKERQKMRIAADDPLAMIQKGVKDLREVEKQKRRWKEERQREMEELERAERKRARRKKVSKEDEELEGFGLDRDRADDAQRQRHRNHGDDRKHRRRHHSEDKIRERGGNDHHRDKARVAVTGWEVGPGGRYSSQFAEVKS